MPCRLALLTLLTIGLCVAGEAADPDAFIASAFRLKEPALRHSTTVYRYSVSEELEAVIAVGGPHKIGDPRWWGQEARLGLFLQHKTRPNLVYALDIITAEYDSIVRVARAEPGFVVLSRQPEKGAPIPTLKLVFDARAKSLVRKMEYQPFHVPRVITQKGVPHLVATNDERELLLRPSGDSFRIVSNRPAAPESVQQRPEVKLPALPQSTYDTFAAVRLRRVRDGYVRGGAEIQEEVGPHQRFDGRIWFGKSFYDAEGVTGVGGFGYFDPATRKFTVYSPPEIVDWSVSALLVEPDAVWLGLLSRGEYGGSPGGLLRWDQETHDARKYSLSSIIGAMIRHEGRLYLGTSEGAAVVGDDRIREFFIDMTPGGSYEIAERYYNRAGRLPD